MPEQDIQTLATRATQLLRELIATPSFSREEDQTAGLICRFLGAAGIPHERLGHNVVARNRHFDPALPAILLNSHHDTVRPNPGYTLDPFKPLEKDGKLFGLGSNDAGAALVSLIGAFLHFYEQKGLRYNLILAATAEEEISGSGGIERVLPTLPPVRYAIVGEPTQMQMAVAEKGLLVLDVTVRGRAGHAAREEGENAIYRALPDLEWFRTYRFPRQSELLGPVRMSVTVIQTENRAHNVVPDLCRFVVDIRVNEQYSFEEILDTIRRSVAAQVEPRSLRMRSSMIPLDHELVRAGQALGLKAYGSPTTSDKALLPFPALKIGPGDSARSHTADEYIFVREIAEGIEGYIRLLEPVLGGAS